MLREMRCIATNRSELQGEASHLVAQSEPQNALLDAFGGPSLGGSPALQREDDAHTSYGEGTMRRYGRGASHPSGYFALACSSLTEPAMITLSPCFHWAGVATWWLAVSWSESITRSTSSKLRPVVIG